jgi:DNA-binding IscR family transcriptional regulator
LFRISTEMKLAVSLVLRLAGDRQQSAPVAEVAAGLGVSVEELQPVLAGLAQRRVLDEGNIANGIASLVASVDTLTLADLAEAAGEWLTVAGFEHGAENTIPGLSDALSVVRERATEGLRGIRVARFLPTQP